MDRRFLQITGLHSLSDDLLTERVILDVQAACRDGRDGEVEPRDPCKERDRIHESHTTLTLCKPLGRRQITCTLIADEW